MANFSGRGIVMSKKEQLCYGRVSALVKHARRSARGKPLNSKGTRCLIVSQVSEDEKSPVIALRYYKTEVIRWYPNGMTSVSLNGWNTVSTRAVIHACSLIRVRTDRGLIFCGNMLGDASTWFWFNQQGSKCIDESGASYPEYIRTRVPRPLVKSRDPLSKPLDGDVLQDLEGQFWLVQDRKLHEYAGDNPASWRHAMLAGPKTQEFSVLEQIVRAHQGWKAVPRFEWRGT